MRMYENLAALSIEKRELPHTPTYTVQRECTQLQPVRSLHAQAHHVHCTETQGPARGATVSTKY